MIEYKDITYVGASKKLICRDGNKQYADSMDLEFLTYKDYFNLYEHIKCSIIDIAVGWTTPKDLSDIEILLKYDTKVNKGGSCKKVFFRLVDQFKHQESSEVYTIMKELSRIYNIPIIGTYDVDYYGLNVAGIVPYPYLTYDELDNSDINKRIPGIILTGSDIKDIYPMRYKLYNLSSEVIDSVKHPGYSGKHWSTGCIGDDYLKMLSRYQFMACTTCIEDYELLKYVECAEAGCIPIGELPSSLKGTEAEKYFIEIPNEVLGSSDEFNEWFGEICIPLDYELFSNGYRNAIKELNDKENLKSLLLSIVNK